MKGGRKKGKVKDKVIIADDLISPYYITRDVNMYSVHREDSSQVYGYHGTLGFALKKCVDLLVLDRNLQQTVTIKQYINEYKTLSTEIIKRLDI